MGIGAEVLKNLLKKPFTKKYPKKKVKPPVRKRTSRVRRRANARKKK